jgi:hypothetical protein
MFRGLSSMRLLHLAPIQTHFCRTGSKNIHIRSHEVNETVTDWLNGLAVDFHNEGIVKLV